MRSTAKAKSSRGIGVVVLIVLIVSILMGFVFDLLLTQIEYAVYRKPAEYQGFVTKYSTEFGVPENLVYAVIKTESGFDTAAVSENDAVGLMQLTKTTFEDIRDRLLNDRHMDAGMRYDPETNIRYGVKYLSYLYTRFGHWDTVIIAYFEGETRVAEWLEDISLDSDKNGVLDRIPNGYEKGQNYLNKVNNSWQYYDKLY